MALQDMSAADLAAVVGNDNDGGFGNGNGWWIILLFLFLGWGNRGFGNGGAGEAGIDSLYPWMNQAQTAWNGFSNVQQDLCNGFAGTTAAITNGFANAETAATARQMANMQQQFDLSQQFANCCCENRLATANQTATILAENCADRAALSDGVRDIIQSQTANTQSILDKLCALELEGVKQQLAQAVHHGTVQKRRHGQMQHVAHGHVHQHDQQRRQTARAARSSGLRGGVQSVRMGSEAGRGGRREARR